MTSKAQGLWFIIKVAFEVIMAVTVQSTVFWLVMPWRVERAKCFIGIYSLCLQGQSISHAENQQKQVGC
jgi:hypothetical protein